MSGNFSYRPATPDDLDFCIDAVVQAEKSRSSLFPYSKIFNISEKEMRNIIRSILIEDIKGQELALSAFTIATQDDLPVGACASWVEQLDGMSSNTLKSDILSHFIPEQNFEQALPILKMLQPLNIEREPLSIQLESLYVKKEHRSMEAFLQLIDVAARVQFDQNPNIVIQRSYGAFSGHNAFMARAVLRIGYVQKAIVTIENKEALNYIPSLSRIIMVKQY